VAAGTGTTGSPALAAGHQQHQLVELGGAQDRPRQPGPLDQPLGLELGPVVAVGDAVNPHDGDVDPVGAPRGPGGPEQVAGAVDVDTWPEGVAGAVDDHPHAGDRLDEAVAAEEVAGHPPDVGRCAGRAGAAAEHPDLVAGGPQPRYDLAPQAAGAAGDQDR
jgi:hypothetical protein